MKVRDRAGLIGFCTSWWSKIRGHLLRRSDNPPYLAESQNPSSRTLDVYPTISELASVPAKLPATVDQSAICKTASYEVVIVHDHSFVGFSFVVDRLHGFSSRD
jgi:hypothetical protein